MISGTESSTSGNNVSNSCGWTDDMLIYILDRVRVWDPRDTISGKIRRNGRIWEDVKGNTESYKGY